MATTDKITKAKTPDLTTIPHSVLATAGPRTFVEGLLNAGSLSTLFHRTPHSSLSHFTSRFSSSFAFELVW